jgi:hypothetical protein
MRGVDSYWADWTARSACLSVGTEAFYPVGNDDDWKTPRKVCLERCSVRSQCLDDVMTRELGKDHKTRFGITGGLSPLERLKYEPEWLAEQQGDAA